jgi:DNA-binding MarR family transcriptional regulator
MDYRETMSRLTAALGSIDSVYAVIARRHNLTFNDLMVIYILDEAQAVTQKQICNTLYLPKSTVHSILLDFIKQGYVTLDKGSNNKEKHIIVTECGGDFFADILKETRYFEESVLRGLGDETCAFLIETTERLGAIMKTEVAKLGEEVVS